MSRLQTIAELIEAPLNHLLLLSKNKESAQISMFIFTSSDLDCVGSCPNWPAQPLQMVVLKSLETISDINLHWTQPKFADRKDTNDKTCQNAMQRPA